MTTITCPKCGTENSSDAMNCSQCRINLQLALEHPEEIEAIKRREQSPAPTTQNGIYCSACGHFNLSWRSECERCRTKLVSPDRPAYTGSRERPGCVTAYAILLGISAGLSAVGGIIVGIDMLSEEYGVVGLVIIVVATVIAALYFLLARGLWRLKNWARIIVIVLQSLGILSSLLSACSAAFGGAPSYTSYGSIVGLAIGVYIIYWFASHGEYFE